MKPFDPEPWAKDLQPTIAAKVKQSNTKIVVLDDDPTGTQTVHDLSIYTSWHVEILQQAFREQGSLFYILTNSRSLNQADAQRLAHDIGENLRLAAKASQQAFSVISRSDSTLRGHYPAELNALAEGLQQKVDAHIIVPAFFEGGRVTLRDVHYIRQGDTYTPVNETPFAQDAVFGYKNANLKKWVVEKTNNALVEADVLAISLEDLRVGGPDLVAEKLLESHAKAIIVNATSYSDLNVFTLGLLEAEARGKNYLYRTAASFVVSRAGIRKRDLLTPQDFNLSRRTGGLIMVGSYVPLSSKQLEHLLRSTKVTGIELNVTDLLENRKAKSIIQQTLQKTNTLLEQAKDVVIYTSRDLIKSHKDQTNLSIGAKVSGSLVSILQGITVRPNYLVAKGGITSSDLATQGLGVQKARVKGQILPGVPVWQLGNETKFAGLNYIVFPGNVGEDSSLSNLVQMLR